MAKESARIKKPESMRDKAVKHDAKSQKPRRIKSGAAKIAKPFVVARNIAKKEYYVVKPHEAGLKGFLTKSRRWTPGYFRSAFKELKNVTWPSRRETWKLSVSVFVFSIVFGLIIAVVDYGLDKLFKKAFL